MIYYQKASMFLFLSILFFGCKHSKRQPTEGGATSMACPLEKYSSWYCKDYSSTQTSVTWFGDVLPFLNSNVPGARFRCTTCHTEYGDYDYVIERPELVQNMIAAMRQEDSRRVMPRSGDRVPDKFIQMFKLFVTNPVKGDPEKAPNINRWPDEVQNDDQ